MDVLNNKKYGAHILALPYPSQGRINPMLQFCKRLVSKSLKTTLAITNFISHSVRPISNTVGIDTISDGFDEGGYAEADTVVTYLERFKKIGSQTLADLIKKYEKSEFPITCVIYDAFMPWALDVAKDHGLIGACFFTQACAVNYIYYYVHQRKLTLPISSPPVRIPGLPELELRDMPSFIYIHGTYRAYFELVLNQFINVDKADYVFVNSFYKLEAEVVDTMSKVTPVSTIGPTLPSLYLDNRVENDIEYGLSLFHVDASTCINWLNTKVEGSVVYVAFGSMSTLDNEQMKEIAWGLKATNCYFLWVVRTSDEAKIPKNFIEETSEKGLLINWSPQLQVLSNKAIGCFFTHGGWNSTTEALSLGVPMVVMPLWTDQTTNAKLVQDVWSVGVRVNFNEKGFVGREEIEKCVRTVIEGDKGKEMKKNALKWKDLAKEAVNEGGTSDKNIEEFVSKCTK
ncbi:PREDICTED: UDP-glycosyltransferase 74F2-like [Nicotiana attenuata]|uniref:Glycosyltransferase n=1 Tax=Nicotiana attenuata TaxID=49451 RepID=A0A314KRH1_NICAT|nr:PREDICTED: UDP-glycosyltransferase 74F2-like [Nicotiana attenuata]OIT31349.1 udp-glycosyltransferase 74f2 [Nicotiana attenuata]